METQMKKEKTKYPPQEIQKMYDLEKLNIWIVELFEITNKYQKYRHTTKKWYLRPLYELVFMMSYLISEVEAAHAILRQ